MRIRGYAELTGWDDKEVSEIVLNKMPHLKIPHPLSKKSVRTQKAYLNKDNVYTIN